MFTPYIMSQAQHVSRLDLAWDQYFPESLKAETCSKGAKGVGRLIERHNVIPGNWQEFLCTDDNKV